MAAEHHTLQPMKLVAGPEQLRAVLTLAAQENLGRHLQRGAELVATVREKQHAAARAGHRVNRRLHADRVVGDAVAGHAVALDADDVLQPRLRLANHDRLRPAPGGRSAATVVHKELIRALRHVRRQRGLRRVTIALRVQPQLLRPGQQHRRRGRSGRRAGERLLDSLPRQASPKRAHPAAGAGFQAQVALRPEHVGRVDQRRVLTARAAHACGEHAGFQRRGQHKLHRVRRGLDRLQRRAVLKPSRLLCRLSWLGIIEPRHAQPGVRQPFAVEHHRLPRRDRLGMPQHAHARLGPGCSRQKTEQRQPSGCARNQTQQTHLPNRVPHVSHHSHSLQE